MSTTLPTRLVRLLAGLFLFGASVALMVRADLGLSSWDVLHQGLADRTGLPLGWVVNGVALLVLLLWFPLRQRPGVGTVANVALVGLALDAVLAVLPPLSALPARIGLLVLGVLLNGVATGLYLGARLGPGPRDGLMTGLAARGLPVGRVRTLIELVVLALGWLLGGTAGPGTLLYALAIGPLAQFLIPRLAVPAPGRPAPTGVTSPCPA
ncbi:YczE/YyaS/YitT family protein [Micromonospora sp. CA-244673]|uniref:membrane protein YczE n=1 Tax=Micromonospora sp. CA-244673 TaxID=3239958 RepID=UPI003D939379